MVESRSAAWYRRAFGDDYIWLYSHRSVEEAEREVLTAVEYLHCESSCRVLDLACGAGRHMRAFSRIGMSITGVDISEVLLARAREALGDLGGHVSLVRADMRCLPFCGCFDGVTMWFTSFGYFRMVAEDRRVLESIRSTLRRGGWWWIDIPNPAYLAATLVPESERDVESPNGPAHVTERRKIVRDRVVKRIEITDSLGSRSFVERVRLYPPERFGALIRSVGLTARGILGDYDGSPFTPNVPRQIWFGIRP